MGPGGCRPRRSAFVTQSQQSVPRFFRAGLMLFAAALPLVIYRYTHDPTGEIKWLLVAWAGLALGGGWLVFRRLFSLSAPGPRLFPELPAILVGMMILSACGRLLLDARAGAFHGGVAHLAAQETGRFIALLALWHTAAQVIRTPAHLMGLFKALCAAVFLAAVYAAVQKAGLDPFPWGESPETMPSTFGNPNYAAHVLVVAVIASAWLALEGWKPAWLFGLGAAWYLWNTGQRGGLVALAAGLGLLLVARIVRGRVRRPEKAAALSLVLAAVLAAGGAAALMGGMKARTGSAFPLDTSILLRYQSLTSASRMIMDRPLLGRGPGVYKMENPAYWTPYEREYFASESTYNHHVHNDPLEIGVDAGLVAAGAWLALLVFATGCALVLAFSAEDRAGRRTGYALSAMFAAFAVDGLFGFNLRLPVSGALFFVLAGALEGIASERGDAPAPGGAPAGPGWPLIACALLALAAQAVLASLLFASEYHLKMGLSAQETGNHPLAARQYAAGARLAPGNWKFPWRLGQLAMLDGRMDEASAQFAKTLSLNPTHLMARIPLAETQLQRVGRMDHSSPEALKEALALLEEAFQHGEAQRALCPEMAEASDVLGRTAALTAELLAAGESPQAHDRARDYWEQARGHLERAAGSNRSQKNRPAIYRNLARVCMSLKDWDGAEEALMRAARIDPEDSETWPLFLEYANTTRRFDRLRKALDERIDRLRRAPTPDTDTLATAQLFLASVMETGYQDLDSAENACAAAVHNAPRRPEVWTNVARFAFSAGRAEFLKTQVTRSCEALARRKPAAQPLPQVAAVNAVLTRGPEALENATLVLAGAVRSLRPERALSPAQTYGWAAYLLGETLQRSDPATPGRCAAALNLSMVFAGTSHLDNAEALLRLAETCLPEDMRTVLALQWADLRALQERYPEAMAVLDEALRADPGNLELRWSRARALYKQGRHEDALAEYDRLAAETEMDPQSKELLTKEIEAARQSLETSPASANPEKEGAAPE